MDDVMDIDLDLGHDPAEYEVEAEALDAEIATAATAVGAIPSGSFDPAPDKIHIRGLDNLSTEDIETYLSRFYPLAYFKRVEWIDDTSANLIFEHETAASDALRALSGSPQEGQELPPTELRKAHPAERAGDADVPLWIRQASLADKKKPRAHEASRFYLLNPEKDPRELRRKQLEEERGSNRRRGGGRENADYRRRQYNAREDQKRESEAQFDESMYDDEPASLTARIDRPLGAQRYGIDHSGFSSDQGARMRGRGAVQGQRGDLFGGSNLDGRLRNRSASPTGDGDGRMGFEEDGPERERPRQRSLSPVGSHNRGKELFDLQPRENAGKELFPQQHIKKRSRELFPHMTHRSNHRRSDAMDTDETAALKRDLASRITGGPSEGSLASRITKGDLADRITGAGDFGRLSPALEVMDTHPSPPREEEEDAGFNIRGAATAGEQDMEGFSIRGAATATHDVKELFPSLRTGNAGKELFGEKIRGRGGPRRKAEDMFS